MVSLSISVPFDTKIHSICKHQFCPCWVMVVLIFSYVCLHKNFEIMRCLQKQLCLFHFLYIRIIFTPKLYLRANTGGISPKSYTHILLWRANETAVYLFQSQYIFWQFLIDCLFQFCHCAFPMPMKICRLSFACVPASVLPEPKISVSVPAKSE